MSDTQRVTRSRTMKRSVDSSNTEGTQPHRNESRDLAAEHADEEDHPQEATEQAERPSRRQASEVRTQLKELKARNQILTLQLRISELERESRSTSGHRRQHSDDHYKGDARKRANRSREPKEQSVTNYDSLTSWLRDCEDYISAAKSDFTTEEEKIRWSASYLAEKPRNQWRDHVTEMRRRGEKPDWKYYAEHLRARISNPEIRNYQTERKLEAAKQRADQSVADFEQYLNRLYADLNYTVPDETRMMYLRMKVDESIINESLRISHTPRSYSDLLKHFIGIELHLRGTGVLSKIAGHKTEKSTFQKGSRSSHGKAKPAAATEDAKSSSASAKLKSSGSKRDVSPAKITCWSCKQTGHKSDNSICPNYAIKQEARNHGEGAGKAKA